MDAEEPVGDNEHGLNSGYRTQDEESSYYTRPARSAEKANPGTRPCRPGREPRGTTSLTVRLLR
jgi:hypothetical protein